MDRDPTAALLGALVVLLIGLAILIKVSRRQGVMVIALVAVGLRLVRSVQLLIIGDLDDAVAYDNLGTSLVRYWNGQGPDPTPTLGKDGFPTMLAGIYSIFGHAPEIGYVVNALAGALAVVVVAATTTQMGWLQSVRPAAWLVALWPVGVVWGGGLLREAIVTLLLAIGAWGAVRLYKLQFASGALAIMSSGLAMVYMRGGLAFLVLIGMPLVAAIAANVKARASFPRWFLAAAVIAVGIIALNLLTDYFQSAKYFEYRPEVSLEQNAGTSSFSQAGLNAVAANQSLSGHAARVPYVAFGPFPWQITNLSLAQAAFDALLWVLVWTFAIYGMLKLARRAEALLFTVPMAALVVALAANSTNFGLIIRLRGQGIVLIAPLAAFGFIMWREKHRRTRTARQARAPHAMNRRYFAAGADALSVGGGRSLGNEPDYG